MVLRLEQVSKTYRTAGREVVALREVDLELEAGSFVAVQGPSGCGKSTLLLTAGGLLRPDTGTVELEGQSLYDLTPEQRAQLRATKLGFVFQQFHLIPYLTVRDNVLAATLGAASGDQDREERTTELLEKFGLTARVTHTPDALSTGERQRVALARALFHDPRLILADEPTGNLDERNAETVMTTLASLAEEGRAVLLVTHDSRAAAHARQTIALEPWGSDPG